MLTTMSNSIDNIIMIASVAMSIFMSVKSYKNLHLGFRNDKVLKVISNCIFVIVVAMEIAFCFENLSHLFIVVAYVITAGGACIQLFGLILYQTFVGNVKWSDKVVVIILGISTIYLFSEYIQPLKDSGVLKLFN